MGEGRLLTAAAAVFFLASTFAQVAADEAPAGIVTSAAMERTTYLSTQKVQAKLSVYNATAGEITLETGQITFLVTSQGKQQSQQYCNYSCWRSVVRISPGAHRDVSVTLPSCDAIADPCAQSVVMTYSIVTGKDRHAYTAALAPYRVLPDPNAVFRDVNGSVPVIVAFGALHSTFEPNTIRIGVVAAPESPPLASPPEALFAGVGKSLRDRGISIDQTVYETDDASFYLRVTGTAEMRRALPYPKANTWRAVYTIRNVTAERIASINAAAENLRRSFGARISKVTLTVKWEGAGPGDDLWKAAQDSAEPQVRRFLDLIGGGELDWTKTARSATSLSLPNARRGYYDPDAEIDLPNIDELYPVEILARVEVAYQGDNPVNATFPAAIASIAAPAFRSSSSTPDTSPAVEMASDRPELLVQGTASAKDARTAGLDPDAVALLHARAQSAALAKALGVRLGRASLFVLDTQPEADYPSVGLATVFSGIAQARQSAADSRVKVERWDASQTLKRLPIAIPLPEKTIAALTNAHMAGASHRLRFEIDASASGEPPQVDVDALAAKLRAVTGVLRVAARTHGGGMDARFEVLLPRSQRAIVYRLASLVRAAYARSRAEITFSLSPYFDDCGPNEAILLKSAIGENWREAEQSARVAHRQVRKLLLAQLLPRDDVAVCPPFARDPGRLEYQDVDTIPAVLRDELSSTVLMIFRTE